MHSITALLAALLLAAPQGAQAARYWLAGPDPVTQVDKQRSGPADYMNLFDANAPWQQAAAQLNVFKVSSQFVHRAPDAMLARLVAALRGRHVMLAMESGMLATDRGCGRGEGYRRPGTLDRAMARLKQAGATLDFIAMDEVVWFGRENSWKSFKGLPRCQDSVEELAREVAASTAVVRHYFPNAGIGDIEVVSDRVDQKRLVADYLEFADRFRALTGTSLAFWHGDVSWHSNYQPMLPPLRAGLRARGVRFGVVVGGGKESTTDIAWVAKGLERLRGLQADPATALDDVVVQSWQPLPTRMLPETEPGTFTYWLRHAEMIAQ